MNREHTWDLYLRYHACPRCRHILESRQNYTYQLGRYYKNLTCPQCGLTWREEKKSPGPVGPLFGNPSKPEFNWE